MEIKLINTSLSYLGAFTMPVRTTEYNEPVSGDLVRYKYQLKLDEQDSSVVIDFTSGNADLLPTWMQYHFSTDKLSVGKSVLSNMDILISDSEVHLRSNIERLKLLFMEDSSFGSASFRIGDNEIVHPTLSHKIEIQDLKIFTNNQLTYRKSGVYVESERPMLISECRHLMEWLPSVNRLKLINKDISSGQKFSSQSNPYLVFDLDYSEDSPSFQWDDALGKGTDDKLYKWYVYATQLIDDMDINNRIYSLLKEELSGELATN
ncbi:hypothetical protein [Paenibacillus sp. EPM92]|uniref:hypothetical protein n=1 Tax=Paenibacillus sp. EPM92 TaxID=1561195 RepID=UPI00191522AA|nr:hypothetical protein [Paenibacillus sp. EPM92]